MSTSDGLSARNRSAANSGRVPFVPAFVAELYDSRLNSDEKVLLWILRYRSGANGSTWVSWRTLAEETGRSKSTVMRQVKKLKELNFLSTNSRGFGETGAKCPESPLAMYDPELCDSHTIGRYFDSGRSPEELATLMSAKNVDNGRDGVTYFIRAGDLVKIGTTCDIEKRLASIQRGSPTEVELLGTVPGGREIEQRLHWEFREHRDHGEWFRADPELVSYIQETLS